VNTFRQAADQHGYPASTLTDNGMVYTVRLAGHGRHGGRTALEKELAHRGITQKNSRPGHPTGQVPGSGVALGDPGWVRR
jgi:transposase InsO family protein